MIFLRPEIHKDDVWNSLIEPNETLDVITIELLELLFGAFSITTQRLLVDHLEGGIYNSITDSVLVQEVSSVPTTNVAPERDFAVLDRMVREKPNASTIALEAFVMYSHNKTSLWLQNKTCEERKVLFQAARALAPSIRKQFKMRSEEIQLRLEQMMVKKQEEIKAKEQKILMRKEALTKSIAVVGFWLNREHVEEGLQKLTKQKEKVQVLKLQINFRHYVLAQSHSDSSLFRFSCNRKLFSVDRLKENLLKLLNGIPHNHYSPPLDENGNTSPDHDISNSTSPSLALDDPADNTSAEVILTQPEFLVGKKIRHQFDVNGELVWYDGKILCMNSDTKEFEIKYDGDEDTFWFTLFDDLNAGDLIIL